MKFVFFVLIAANLQGQTLSDEAKYRILQAWTHGNAVLAELQQAQVAACKQVPACEKKLEEFQVAKKTYDDLTAKEAKPFPPGTTFAPDAAKMDVVVSIPKKAEPKPEAKKQ